jgi:hypothetical protein
MSGKNESCKGMGPTYNRESLIGINCGWLTGVWHVMCETILNSLILIVCLPHLLFFSDFSPLNSSLYPRILYPNLLRVMY